MTSPTYEELQAEFAQLFSEHFPGLHGPSWWQEAKEKYADALTKLAASEETVRELHDAMWDSYTSVVPMVSRLRELAASAPNGASALAEMAKLREALRELVDYAGSNTVPLPYPDDWLVSAPMRLWDKAAELLGGWAALSERSTSPAGDGS